MAAIPLQRKSDAAEAFLIYINRLERLTGNKVVNIRSDGGGEFGSNALLNEYARRGICFESTAHYKQRIREKGF